MGYNGTLDCHEKTTGFTKRIEHRYFEKDFKKIAFGSEKTFVNLRFCQE